MDDDSRHHYTDTDSSVQDKMSTASPEQLPRPWYKGALDEAKFLLATKEGLVGDYDYAYLLTPDIYPFNKKFKGRAQPFFGIDDRIPLLLTLLLGIQHALAMIGGVVSPPLLVAGAAGANLSDADISYLISASLILSGVFSLFQIIRIPLFGGLYLGTGMLTVVGEAFAIVPVAQGFFRTEYAAGRCPSNAAGDRLPCPAAYGKLLGTTSLVMVFQIALSLIRPRTLKRMFPNLVTGMVVVCIGMSLVSSGIKSWAGGAGPCMARPDSGFFAACPNTAAPHPHPWGHPAFLGLGFSVYATILITELWGSPLLRNGSVALGLLVGASIAGATGYIDTSAISAAPAGTFLWTTTFPLGLAPSLVLPLVACCITTLVSCLGDVVATADVSDVDPATVDTRIQGGLTADALWSVLSPLCTTTPTVCFAQNVGVIALTNCASRRAGYACCFFLVLAGVAARFGAAVVALPDAVIGGMTTFLFTSIVTSGLRILAKVRWTRRSRFIATATLVFGLSDLVAPDWALYLLPPGGGAGLQGLKDGVGIVVRTSYCIVAFVGVFLNAVLPEEPEAERRVSLSLSDGRRED
ncbi:permease family-domain-containing protein [Geopyxis carbonaria]|nr:permease family-domain-containing protein [Geopyxis carbonaria]